mgnify:CR=1 FL=1
MPYQLLTSHPHRYHPSPVKCQRSVKSQHNVAFQISPPWSANIAASVVVYHRHVTLPLPRCCQAALRHPHRAGYRAPGGGGARRAGRAAAADWAADTRGQQVGGWGRGGRGWRRDSACRCMGVHGGDGNQPTPERHASRAKGLMHSAERTHTSVARAAAAADRRQAHRRPVPSHVPHPQVGASPGCKRELVRPHHITLRARMGAPAPQVHSDRGRRRRRRRQRHGRVSGAVCGRVQRPGG